MFLSTQIIKDWAYEILDDDDDWKFRQFDESKSLLSILTDYEDVLKECHVTWTPGNFNIRAGKQIVAWSRMDFVRIMDQINPRDTRRGFADTEFETSIIPIWLVKGEYYPQTMPGFLMDLGFEFTFNPNADFIPNKKLSTGNYKHGIWAADSLIPSLNGRAAALIEDIEQPSDWDSDGFEYFFRIKGMFQDSTYFTLNYFDGVDNDPVSLYDPSKIGDPIDLFGASIPGLNGLPYVDDKGYQLIETFMQGYYPDKRYAGFTVSRDFESLYVKALGGVAPLLRAEFIYEFDSTFITADKPTNDFEKHDAIFYGVSGDWKVKWNLLNPRRYFSIVPVFAHRYVQDYPDDYNLTVKENTYTLAGSIYTYYLHDKLNPTIAYQRELAGSVKSELWIFKLKYSPNETWTYKAQLFMLQREGFHAVRNKDNISFTIQYQF
jgi:hypothetical protein